MFSISEIAGISITEDGECANFGLHCLWSPFPQSPLVSLALLTLIPCCGDVLGVVGGVGCIPAHYALDARIKPPASCNNVSNIA